jgi:tRNA-uridine 2-sulfurtransferase
MLKIKKTPKEREMARKYNLVTAEKKDSQGICFIGDVAMKTFLKRIIDTTPGNVINEDGNVVGTHDGAVLYTLGERHGFSVPATDSSEKPYYVISKDVDRNTITVSQTPKETIKARAEIAIQDCNWITDKPPDGECQIRYRYRQPLLKAHLKTDGNKAIVTLPTPVSDAAAGQSLVVYDATECVGGGIMTY